MKERLFDSNDIPSVVQGISLDNVEALSHTGIYSTVWKAQVYEGDRQSPTDVIVKKHDIDPATLDTQLKDWENYRKIIALHESITGISVPRTLAYEVKDTGIFFVDESSGARDISKVLADEEIEIDRRHELLAALFGSLSRIPRDENQQTSFMIDGKFSNFCLTPQGTLAYIDLFPAHTRNDASHLLKPSADHLEEKRSLYTDSFVTGDMYGILGIFMGTLRKDHPDLWTTIGESRHMQEALHGLPQDLREYCTFLIENDAIFVQALYGFGIRNPTNPQLDAVLNPAQYKNKVVL